MNAPPNFYPLKRASADNISGSPQSLIGIASHEAIRVKVNISGPYCAIEFPFDKEVKETIKDLHPDVHFNPYRGTWLVPIDYLDPLKRVLVNGIGTDGIVVDMVDVRVKLVSSAPVEAHAREGLALCNQELVTLNGHCRARLARGVRLVHGTGYSRRIEVANWRVGVQPCEDGRIELLIIGVARTRALAMQKACSERVLPPEFAKVDQIEVEML